MTALDYLRKLTEIGPFEPSEFHLPCCHFCRELGLHTPDCPWVAAKGFVEEQDRPRSTDYLVKRFRSEPRGFTLIELLVVILIILAVSAVALPTALSALSHRQVSEGARTLSAALAGARDAAIKSNAPAGIRLLADATLPNACSSIVPLSSPPDYSEGLVSTLTGAPYSPALMATILNGTQALVLLETVNDPLGLPNEPTAWMWNVRVGDKLQINNAGPWLTVCGPMVTQNPEGFVNFGSPGAPGPLGGPEYLLVTNGCDDNANGWIDEGFDGVDNNGNGQTDETTEWEQETWRGSLINGVRGVPYVVHRRPLPTAGSKTLALPTNVVVDLSRSRLSPLNGVVDIIVNPNGKMFPSLPYSTPASLALASQFFQFWLAERADLGHFDASTPPVWVQSTPAGQYYLITANGGTGRVSTMEQPDLKTGLIQAMQGQ
jgi:prepilin-type N-terminal cleavage/methylation domain-containing protein